MKAKIIYTLSQAGQRAALAAGQPAMQEQAVDVEVSNGDLELFRLCADGTLADLPMPDRYGEYSSMVSRPLDALLTPDTAISAIRAARAENEACVLARTQQQRDVTIAALRRSIADGEEMSYIDPARGVRHNYSDPWLSPDDADPEVASLVRQALSLAHGKKAAAEAAETRRKAIYDITQSLPGEWTLLRGDRTATGKVRINLPSHDWAKYIAAIDPAQKGGYAFDGDPVRDGQECEIGTLLLVHQSGGSRKHPTDMAALYIVTPSQTSRVEAFDADWRIPYRDRAAELLQFSAAERVREIIQPKLERTDCQLVQLAAIDTHGYPEVSSAVEDRRKNVADARATFLADLAALDANGGDSEIDSIDAAARAIVATGYRTLAKIHHPDAGGSAEAMANLSSAKAQLVELLKLAAAGGAR